MSAKLIMELCQNHKGDLTLLKEMVWVAKESGADFVKIQSMLADDLTHRPQFDEGRIQDGKVIVIKRPYAAEYQRLKPMDLSDQAHHIFLEECKKASVIPMTTIFSRSRIPFVASLRFSHIKVASFDCASYPMLRELSERFEHIIVSTGATDVHEIEQAAQIFKDKSFVLLHCVSIYPTRLEAVNLKKMLFLKKFTPHIGFSDHTNTAKDGIKASMVALALGAEYIERHFTLLPADQTKDGPVSIGPKELSELAVWKNRKPEEILNYAQKEIPEFLQIVGDGHLDLSHEELLNQAYYRGRFASRQGSGWVYNWEEQEVFHL